MIQMVCDIQVACDTVKGAMGNGPWALDSEISLWGNSMNIEYPDLPVTHGQSGGVNHVPTDAAIVQCSIRYELSELAQEQE